MAQKAKHYCGVQSTENYKRNPTHETKYSNAGKVD